MPDFHRASLVITDEHGNDSVAIRPMTYLCMSWDHRAFDGALGAQFLSSLRGRLEAMYHQFAHRRALQEA